MACKGNDFLSLSIDGGEPRPLRASVFLGIAIASLGFTLSAGAQGPVRCDLQVKSTPGAGAATACLDLLAMQSGGTPFQTAGNATRISTDGFRLCKNAFLVGQPAGADIVFIYDNSGSMVPGFARVNAANPLDTMFYHIDGCNGGSAVGTPYTYTTQLGPRNIQLVGPTANCPANSYAGDPYFARGKVIEKALDYLATQSPTSTAGAMSFAQVTANLQPPLLLSVPGNANLVKASIVLDSIRSTNYVPPLTQATAWLTSDTYKKNAKQAIVFISDGEPTDNNDLTTWLRNNGSIPIYTIALGGSNVTFTRMEEMSELTGGTYHRVAPNNPAEMDAVMQQIIKAITVLNLPTGIEITNNSFSPPMVSRSESVTRDPSDSSVSVVLDSIIPLTKGLNNLIVKVTMSGKDPQSYPVTIKADGTDADSSTTTLECHAMPALVMLNQNGTVDSSYPSGPSQYDVRLIRATSDLEQVVVTARSSDTARPGWGDEESITLPQTASGNGLTTNRRNDYNFNGGAITAAKGNNVLDAAPNGLVTLTWTHPRDARESAVFVLPGRKIPTTAGFIDMIRVTDVPKGVTLTSPVTQPVVIRGGVTLVYSGDQATLTTKGFLTGPKVDEGMLNPNQVPTFIFKTASHFSYKVFIYDHLGHFMNSQEGKVDSTEWANMRANADSMAVAFSILPVASSGQQFGTGVYIMRATLTTIETVRADPNAPKHVTPVTRMVLNRFGYQR